MRTTRSPSPRASSTQRKVPGGLSLILSSAEVAGHEVSAGRRRVAGSGGGESVGRGGSVGRLEIDREYKRSCSWALIGIVAWPASKRASPKRAERFDAKRLGI